MSAVLTTLRSRLRKLDEREDNTFRVFQQAPWTPYRADQPLVIIVHPGDAIQAPHPFIDPDEYEDVRKRSLVYQANMGDEILAALDAGAQVLVVHRGSCSQFRATDCDWIAPSYKAAIERARREGAIIYGDQLDKAGAWIAEHVDIAGRPDILVTGAYNAPDWGCIPALIKELEPHLRGAPIRISVHAPDQN